jgi:hypothetical protein
VTAAVVARLTSPKDSWISVVSVTPVRGDLDLAVVVRQGKRGRALSRWIVRCLGVREARLSDFNGGGLRLYSKTHPVAKQYSDARATVRLSGVTNCARILGVLMQAHVAAVDDWIPFDRYCPSLPFDGQSFVLRGPAFLLRRYAMALRAAGYHPRTVIHSKAVSAQRYVALHFGDSYIVATAFEVLEAPRSKDLRRKR